MGRIADYIKSNLILLDYGGDFIGISDPTLEELFILKGYIDMEIREAYSGAN